MKKRLIGVDIARGIAIIAIIIGHMGVKNVNRVVYTFHVPIFFLITGYFITESTKFYLIIKKRIKTLIIPYYTTCLCIVMFNGLKKLITANGNLSSVSNCVLEWGIASLYGAGTNYNLPNGVKPIGAIWFLMASFWGELILRSVLKLKKEMRIGCLIILFTCSALSVKYLFLPFSIQCGICAALFMYLGYISKELKDLIKKLSNECQILIIVISAITWINFVYYFDSFYVANCNYGKAVSNIIGTICACYFIIWISNRLLSRFRIFKAVAYIGRYSIFMLCLHIWEMSVLPWESIIIHISNDTLPYILTKVMVLICRIVFCILGTIFLSKCNIANKIFGIK
jgi:fucose 4-O-acetylase-like acetyltransferase